MQNSQKAENLVNLSLDATREEREASPVLLAGTDSSGESGSTISENLWEIIVKYHGNLAQYESEEQNIFIEELLAGYAIVTLPESRVEWLASLEETEYLEKPKNLYTQDANGNFQSCLYSRGSLGIENFGAGVLVAVIDSGLSYQLPAFRNEDGTTRVLFYYDQVQEREYSASDLNDILLEEGGMNEDTAQGPTPDISGHGTAVASIAAGNGRQEDGSINTLQIGVAMEAELIIVKLDTSNQTSFPLTTALMRGIDYVIRKGVELAKPVAVNLSFGNTYGAHDGTSLLERFINNMAEIGRTVICVGSGNEGAAQGHTAGIVTLDEGERIIEFTIGAYETSFSLQLWINFTDSYEIIMESPSGEQFQFASAATNGGSFRRSLEQTNFLFYVGSPKPYSVNEEIFFSFIPQNSYINEGVWKLHLVPVRLAIGNYSIYMPSTQVKGRNTRFLNPSTAQTLTIPSTAERVITVGAYNGLYNAYADFSGRGFVTRLSEGFIHEVKPEIVAPGVGIYAENGYGIQVFDGTSYATPFVTGG